MMKKLWVLLITVVSVSLCAAEIMIADNGKANAGIVIPENAKPIVKFAADELKNALEKMTGASFAVGTQPSMPVNFYLGFGDAKDFLPDEYVIAAKQGRIDIYGKDTPGRVDPLNLFFHTQDKGTLRGIYNFLDRLGVRWPAPGAKNEYVPKKTTLKIPEGDIRYTPFFPDRQISGAWKFTDIFPDAKEYLQDENDLYLWGLRNGTSTRMMVPGCHTEYVLRLYENEEWLAHPERWQLKKDGTRCKDYSCWTDPGTKAIWLRAVDAYFSGKTPAEAGFDITAYRKWPFPFISPDEFMIDPMDHGPSNDGRCYCARCEEFRKQYPCADDTEILWKFISEIAAVVQEKHPGKYISTLVYPPKKLLPKYFKAPGNVRVRICLSGPKEMNFPNRLSSDLRLLEDWVKLLGKDNIPLWCYQCASFGRTLPGVPDTYPHLIAAYIKKIKPLSAGMFLENHALTHTFRNMDVFIFMRMMWDPSRNVDDELSAYFTAYYGPAAKEAQAFYNRLEQNWNKLAIMTQKDVSESKDDGSGAMGKNKELLQKTVWSLVYTADEMKKLDSMLDCIEKAAASDPACLERAMLLRKYLFDIMKEERWEMMDKDEVRSGLLLEVTQTSATEFPLESEWVKSKQYKLISAERIRRELKAGGSFRLMASATTPFVHAALEEPDMSASMTNSTHTNGNTDIWKDNCIELFFYAVDSKKFWHIIVNENGVWSSQTGDGVQTKWVQLQGLKVLASQAGDSWTAEIAIPLSELRINNSELRFNFCRERNIKGMKTELSTWSPLAMLENWHDPANYGILIFDNKSGVDR